MPVIEPSHLLDQAERLARSVGVGAPRQADIRRSISSAYYAVFHTVASAAADQFVGFNRRAAGEYRLVYRSIDHGRLHEVCGDLRKPTPPGAYRSYLPDGGIGADFQVFASTLIDLRERRHSADYDPGPKFLRSDAELAIKGARTAISRFQIIPPDSRLSFLSLLVFKPRS